MPSTLPYVQVRMSDSTYRKFSALAKSNKRSRSAMALLLIEEALEEMPVREQKQKRA